MRLEPKRNWISVKIPESKKEENEVVVLLPEDYKAKQSAFQCVEVIKDPQAEYDQGVTIIVPTQTLREVEIENNKFLLVERNFVMAQVSNAEH
tara:strand:+ start:920 stop:1198 length:279 start_codon:yes stop_codon:yes gene_type:complete